MGAKNIYKEISFDSQEEIEMYMWLEEAQAAGLVEYFIYQPTPFILSESVRGKAYSNSDKLKDVHLLRGHIYTADFKIKFTPMFLSLGLKSGIKISEKMVAYIDVKGSYNSFGGDRILSINKKWVYAKYEEIVNKVVPKDLFKKTWCPDGCRLTPKTKQVRKAYENLPSLQDVMITIWE